MREGTDVPWRDPSSDLLISTNTPSPRRIAVDAIEVLNFRRIGLIARLAFFSGVRGERLGLVEPTHGRYSDASRHDAKHIAAAHQRFPLFAHMQPSCRTVPVSAGAEFEVLPHLTQADRPGLGSFASSILGRPPDLNETCSNHRLAASSVTVRSSAKSRASPVGSIPETRCDPQRVERSGPPRQGAAPWSKSQDELARDPSAARRAARRKPCDEDHSK